MARAAAVKDKVKDRVDPETGEVHETTRDVATRDVATRDVATRDVATRDVATRDVATTAGTPGTALVEAGEYDYGADAGAGTENQTSDDVSIPFLVVLQPGSPEVGVDPEKPPFPGYIQNKTTGDYVRGEQGVTFIPCYTQHLFMEWRPRPPHGEGGVVERHAVDSPMARRVRDTQGLGNNKNPEQLAAGVAPEKANDIVETYYVYGVSLNEAGDPIPAVVAFASTHIKAYQDWMFRVRSIVVPLPDGRKLTAKQLPLWATAWRIRSRKHPKSTKDQTWYVPDISMAGANALESLVKPRTDLYEYCKSLKEAVESGERTADESTLTRGPAAPDAAPQRQSTDAEDAPY